MNCNITEVYLSEKFRMSHCGELDGCYKCPLSESNNGTKLTCHNLEKENPKKAIEIVQNWSDKHQPKTYLTEFLGKFPAAKLESNGTPSACRQNLDENVICEGNCYRCWNMSVEEVLK